MLDFHRSADLKLSWQHEAQFVSGRLTVALSLKLYRYLVCLILTVFLYSG